MAYVARTTGVPRAGDDARDVVKIPLAALSGELGEFAFDHSQVRLRCGSASCCAPPHVMHHMHHVLSGVRLFVLVANIIQILL